MLKFSLDLECCSWKSEISRSVFRESAVRPAGKSASGSYTNHLSLLMENLVKKSSRINLLVCIINCNNNCIDCKQQKKDGNSLFFTLISCISFRLQLAR